MLIVTRHGMFSIVSTEEITEDNYIHGQDNLVEIRSMSADDILSLITEFEDIIGVSEVTVIDPGRTISEIFPGHYRPASKHKNGMMYSIFVQATVWVNLLACLGAGITYTNLEDELQIMIDQGESRVNPLLTFIRGVYAVAIQVYSPFGLPKMNKGEVIH